MEFPDTAATNVRRYFIKVPVVNLRWSHPYVKPPCRDAVNIRPAWLWMYPALPSL